MARLDHLGMCVHTSKWPKKPEFGWSCKAIRRQRKHSEGVAEGPNKSSARQLYLLCPGLTRARKFKMDGLFYIGPYLLRLILVKRGCFQIFNERLHIGNKLGLLTQVGRSRAVENSLRTRKSAEHHVVVRGIGQAVLPAMSSQQAPKFKVRNTSKP